MGIDYKIPTVMYLMTIGVHAIQKQQVIYHDYDCADCYNEYQWVEPFLVDHINNIHCYFNTT